VTAREVMNRLRREGWAERPGWGSHIVFRSGDRTVIVPNDPGDLRIGTLRAIYRDAGWQEPPR
jgi:predicted RNA binding protein YcfA (HicA-like mRNA interferase family)